MAGGGGKNTSSLSKTNAFPFFARKFCIYILLKTNKHIKLMQTPKYLLYTLQPERLVRIFLLLASALSFF